MARARNIKPSFFKNELLVEMSALDRLLFVGLWCLADREGRLEDRPKRIKMELFPADSYDVDSGLNALAEGGFLRRYESCGKRVILILNFHKHQTPHGTEKDSDLPDPDGEFTVHERDNKGYVKGKKRRNNVNSSQENGNPPLEGSDQPVNSQGKNALNPDSLIPDSLIPESSSLRSERESAEFAEGTSLSPISPAAAVCRALKDEGVSMVNPGHPELPALLKAGAGIPEFVYAARLAVSTGKASFPYVIGIVKGRLSEAAAPRAPPRPQRVAAEPAWRAEQRARVQQFAPSVAAKPFVPQPDFIDVEATDAVPNRLA